MLINIRTRSTFARLGLLLAGCHGVSGGANNSFSADSAGVAVADNTGPDSMLDWKLDTVAVIGDSSGSIELNQLTEYTVDTDILGHIFIIDSWFGHKVQVIDTAGHFVRTITREGAGPGEVGSGVSISVSDDGILAIMDFSKQGMVRVRWDGTVLPVLPLLGYDLFGGGRASGDTVVLHTLDPRSSAYTEAIRYRAGSDTATLAILTPPRNGFLPFCAHDGMEGLPPMLTPELHWTARGGQTLINRTGEYRIDHFAGPKLARIVRRQVTPQVGTVEAVRRFFLRGKIVGSKECVVPPDELVRKRGVAPVLQPIRRLALDREGRTWAERNTFPDQVPRVDLFDRSGRYLGTLSGFGAPLGFPSRDLLLFALSDSTTDTPKLGIFRRVP